LAIAILILSLIAVATGVWHRLSGISGALALKPDPFAQILRKSLARR
jgi:hypothetical protein